MSHTGANNFHRRVPIDKSADRSSRPVHSREIIALHLHGHFCREVASHDGCPLHPSVEEEADSIPPAITRHEHLLVETVIAHTEECDIREGISVKSPILKRKKQIPFRNAPTPHRQYTNMPFTGTRKAWLQPHFPSTVHQAVAHHGHVVPYLQRHSHPALQG